MPTETEVTKLAIITSMDLFDPSVRDRIETVPLGPDTQIRFRVVSISDATMQAIEATRGVFVRDLRNQFIRENLDGVRTLRLLEMFEEVREQLGLLTLPEVTANWVHMWKLGLVPLLADEGETVPAIPEHPDWTADQYADDLLKLQLVEVLLQGERTSLQTSPTQAMLALTEEIEGTDDVDKAAKVLATAVEREIAERRALLRELPMESLMTRLRYAAAMEPALVISSDYVLVVVLYAVARQEADREIPFFDLRSRGITSVTDALRNPAKTYQEMLGLFRGDEPSLLGVARSVAGYSGMLSQPLLDRIERASQEPFRAESLRSESEAGPGSGVGGDATGADPGTGDVPGAQDVAAARHSGGIAPDLVNAVPPPS
jgi:hypothetical protein